MACSYCDRRSGKRSCPALGGVICASCCGRHRLREIACPSDCVYLGGLAVVRDPTATFTKADYEAAMAKLPPFAASMQEFRNEAVRRCLDNGACEDWAFPLFLGYLYYGHRDARDQRLVDHFLAARGRGLPAGEVMAIRALQQSWASLFEVVAVQAGTGFDVKDLISGETHHVREVSATAELKKWDTLFSWLMPVDDHLEMTGSSSLIPREHVPRIHEALGRAIVAERASRPKLAARDHTGSVSWTVLHTLRSTLRDRRMPELHTTTGEKVVFCKAHYTIVDEPEVRLGLSTFAEIESDGESYTWGVPDENDGGRLVLGRITLATGELVLETMSRERHARGRTMLETVLGAALTHHLDSLQDAEAAMKVATERGPSMREDEVPEDIEREVLGQYLRDYYVNWLDLPIPALGNKSPRKAVRTRKGRGEVEELLKGLEHGLSRQPGGETVDVRMLYRELGLLDDDDEDDILTYDADVTPEPTGWLAEDDQLKAHAVESHHATLTDHVETPNMTMHALIHVIVENQLALGDPPEVRTTLARLVTAGVTRHDAIHALGSVVVDALFEVQKSGTLFDRAKVRRQLSKLKPGNWKRV
jgi:hypothetical protein